MARSEKTKVEEYQLIVGSCCNNCGDAVCFKRQKKILVPQDDPRNMLPCSAWRNKNGKK